MSSTQARIVQEANDLQKVVAYLSRMDDARLLQFRCFLNSLTDLDYIALTTCNVQSKIDYLMTRFIHALGLQRAAGGDTD